MYSHLYDLFDIVLFCIEGTFGGVLIWQPCIWRKNFSGTLNWWLYVLLDNLIYMYINASKH